MLFALYLQVFELLGFIPSNTYSTQCALLAAGVGLEVLPRQVILAGSSFVFSLDVIIYINITVLQLRTVKHCKFYTT